MVYLDLTDNSLQSLAVSGDREAEEALCERYMRLVRMCARPLFLAGGSGEDLIQEGMIGLLSAIRQFDPDNGSSFHYFAEYCSATPEVFRHDPEDLVLARESKEELYDAFSRCLSKMENRVLSCYLDGYSYRDIAARLGKDEKAVDNAVQRIRRKLARNLNPGEISGN